MASSETAGHGSNRAVADGQSSVRIAVIFAQLLLLALLFTVRFKNTTTAIHSRPLLLCLWPKQTGGDYDAIVVDLPPLLTGLLRSIFLSVREYTVENRFLRGHSFCSITTPPARPTTTHTITATLRQSRPRYSIYPAIPISVAVSEFRFTARQRIGW